MTDLQRAFGTWQRAKSRHEQARLDLLATIRLAVESGTPQAEVARVLGWPRQRVSEALR